MTSNPKFTEADVRKIADLARLELSDQEVTKFASQLGDILGYIQKLNELDTTGVEPMTTPHAFDTPLRDDEVIPSLGPTAMLQSAPDQMYENYKVPQVLGES
jgi:aspartyl-tRNA(Asn)/glutamyl-tRNA(Gln) amidotransferase subunit C